MPTFVFISIIVLVPKNTILTAQSPKEKNIFESMHKYNVYAKWRPSNSTAYGINLNLSYLVARTEKRGELNHPTAQLKSDIQR